MLNEILDRSLSTVARWVAQAMGVVLEDDDEKAVEDVLYFSETEAQPDFAKMARSATYKDDGDLELPSVSERRKKRVAARLYGVLVAPPPILFSTSFHNLRAGIVNRCLRAHADLDDSYEKDLGAWLSRHAESIFRGYVHVDPLPFEEWAASFPLATRKTLEKCKDRLKYQSVQELVDLGLRLDTSNVFVKSELQIWDYDDSPFEAQTIEKDPRIIQPTTPEYNVITGPWVSAFQKHLHDVWDLQHWATMGCSRDARDLGIWSLQFPNVIEGDFARFDATITLTALRTFQRICRKFGAPADVIWAFKQRERRCGFTRVGIRFTVEATMDSGNTYTYLLNTIWNVLIQTYSYYRLVQHKMTFAKFTKHYRILASGDDSLVLVSDYLKNLCNLKSVVPLVAKLGCRLEILDEDFYSFCSMYFWYVNGQIAPVAGLKPGRVLRRFPWLMRPQEDWRAQLKGNILGVWPLVHHVPILREYFIAHLELLTGVDANPIVNRFMPAELNVQFEDVCTVDHANRTIKYHPLTMAYLLERYGWTSSTLYEWNLSLTQAKLQSKLEFKPLASVLREI